MTLQLSGSSHETHLLIEYTRKKFDQASAYRIFFSNTPIKALLNFVLIYENTI